jgi:hypothetical protein
VLVGQHELDRQEHVTVFDVVSGFVRPDVEFHHRQDSVVMRATPESSAREGERLSPIGRSGEDGSLGRRVGPVG